MAKRSKRYFHPDDDGKGITPSQLKRLSKARQLEYMEAWFRTYFEDPVNETPYESREGGYQYIWGGPYDALEELDAEFSGTVPADRILELSDTLSDEGLEWAPTSSHPDREDEGREERDYEPPPPDFDGIIQDLQNGVRPNFGGGYEEGLRKDASQKLEELNGLLEEKSYEIPGIGHNHPPDDTDPLAEEIRAQIKDASSQIKAELIKEEPNALTVAKASKVLSDLGKWLAERITKAVDKTIEIGVTAEIVRGGKDIQAVADLLHSASNILGHWLQAIASAF